MDKLHILLFSLAVSLSAPVVVAEEDNPDVPLYDIGDNFHQYPPDYREPDPEAPVRYGRTTSKSFPLQALEQDELAEAQVPGALQATAAGEALSQQESELTQSDGAITIEELENTGIGFDTNLPTANATVSNTSTVTINNQTYNAGGTSNVNVQLDAVVTTRN
ncbi:hypothetical protein [Parendozoicomonas sp. Alg238-R29]|uniref:hypothetical protein n=1 Tax=Parendozoicomonas sp. Alg238-R29 TaxID=2993446 RepID=UPI00248EC86C|nr:hypothetical protein [Parendozoicomonas sp. Alg238-R29]